MEKAGGLHVQLPWLGSHMGVQLEEQRMTPAVDSSCVDTEAVCCEDPLLSGGSWGPYQNVGLYYRPSSYQAGGI